MGGLRARLQSSLAGRMRPRLYEVRAITAGDGNGLHYGAQVLEAALPLFEGVSVFIDHAQLAERFSQTGGRSVRNVLGVLEHVFYSVPGIGGELRVYPGPDAEWFCAMVDQHLLDLAEDRASPQIGLSAVLDVQSRGEEVVSIARVVSVDVVYDPARGGEFIRALNQQQDRVRRYGVEYGPRQEHGIEYEDAGCESREARPPGGGTEEREEKAMAEEEVKQEVVVAPAAEYGPAGGGPGSAPVESPVDRRSVELAVAMGDAVLDARLTRANLPESLAALVRGRFGGRLYNVRELDAEVEALQSAWAKSVAAQTPVRGVGARGELSNVVNEVDKLQAVMDQLVGLKPKSEALQGLRPVSGIRELYLMLSGDYDFRGVFDAERVALANVTTSTMTSLVKNAFNKVILDYFNTVDRWWESIVSQENFGSMQDLTLITLGGFGDLPTVAEGAAYTELSWSDSEEVVSFIKKGGYVGVTLEMMDKDETRTFRAIPRKLATAGYRTLSAAIANLFTANSGVGAYWPASQSTYRLFDASYGNLGSSALTAATWDACIQAMYKMTEATSSERMGIRPSYLVVPIELEKTALTIMESAGEPDTADNDANVRRGSSRVIVCPEMTDANDWMAVADPRVWPGMMVAYRFGSTPEVFIADQETVGSMFTNDEMRIKARFIYAVGVGDYRPLYKANVS